MIFIYGFSIIEIAAAVVGLAIMIVAFKVDSKGKEE